MSEKDFYRRNLPHIQPLGETYFVTFNLADSIPNKVRMVWESYFAKEQEKIRNSCVDVNKKLDILHKKKFLLEDTYLASNYQICRINLLNPQILELMHEALKYWDGNKMEAIAYCIMPNHVHLVFRCFDENEAVGKPKYLNDLMHSIKSYSANQINDIYTDEGRVWQQESYDRLVRDEDELRRIIEYVLDNPVKANLVRSRLDFEGNYINEKYNDFI